MSAYCLLPIGWLGPSDRKKYAVRKGGVINIGRCVGAPVNLSGRRAKIITPYANSLYAYVQTDPDQQTCQVTHIAVPCTPTMWDVGTLPADKIERSPREARRGTRAAAKRAQRQLTLFGGNTRRKKRMMTKKKSCLSG